MMNTTTLRYGVNKKDDKNRFRVRGADGRMKGRIGGGEEREKKS